MGSGKRLAYAKKKYGVENFKKEILSIHESPEEMLAEEARLVNEEFLGREDVYNLNCGGRGCWFYTNATLTKEDLSRRAKVIAQTRVKNGNFSVLSKEAHTKGGKLIAKLGVNRSKWCGKHTVEAKAKIGKANSLKQSGTGNSQYGSCWIHHELIGNKKCKKYLLPEFIEQGWVKGRF
jgi:hypothetical protein